MVFAMAPTVTTDVGSLLSDGRKKVINGYGIAGPWTI
jgi:hypothetical protein